MIDKLLSFLAPHPCSTCGEIGSPMCNNCKYDIVSEPFLGCILCGQVTENGVCHKHKAPFNQAFVTGIRSGGLQRLIGNFKFQNMKSSVNDIADIMVKRLPPLPTSAVIVPVPTSRMHIRERAYDHVLLLAKAIGKQRRCMTKNLIHRYDNTVQHHSSKAVRLVQAKQAYYVKGAVDPTVLYVIIDDITTTGATITQAAQVLKDAGATAIWVLVTAKQPLD